jgi:DNA-binding HxlR family transcriptional regulator
MPRKYDSRCPVARTLNVIGDRWAILILRDFFLQGPRRFQDFEASLKGITPAVLSQRLKELEGHGVIDSRLYAEHPPRRVYDLTEKGRELRPVLLAMKLWGERYTSARSVKHGELDVSGMRNGKLGSR